MPTVAHIVESIMERKPFVQEALSQGIINYAALAEQLEPEVAAELRKPITHAAVMMALRRYAEKVGKRLSRRVLFDANADLTVKSDLVEITLLRSPAVEKRLREIYTIADFQHGDLLTVTNGLREITLITNRKHRDAIAKLFREEEIRIVVDNLASITVRLPPEAIETIGLFYVCTRALNWENIPIVEIVSTYTELTFILKDSDVTVAYKALQRLIREQRD